MNTVLYNLIVFLCLFFKGERRLDSQYNKYKQITIMLCIMVLCILVLIILGVLCFIIQPPSYYSTELAMI